jgi:hypothetical protein
MALADDPYKDDRVIPIDMNEYKDKNKAETKE